MTDHDTYPPIADYGMVTDMHSCALVSKTGSVDWCCFPRFDGAAVFGRILDWRKGGYFRVSPQGVESVTRRYLPGTNVLETTFTTDSGVATLTDFMPIHEHLRPFAPFEVNLYHQVARILRCSSGSVQFIMECFPRFDYGTVVPHAFLNAPTSGFAHGGPDAVSVFCSAPMRKEDNGFVAEGLLRQGEELHVAAAYQSRFVHAGQRFDVAEINRRLDRTLRYWEEWSKVCTYQGKYREDVLRSALTLKGLTYAPSGALLAAATTSLPEWVGGSRNWDYRFTWIRDATFALYSLFLLGYRNEARAFKDWLEWCTLGRAADLQVMYGLGGERRLTESQLYGLEGYRGSRPVRVGNSAHKQFQLDVYGELLDSAHLYRVFVGEIAPDYWDHLVRIVNFVLAHWRDPDEGIWETRGGRQHFVFSKVMCWVALDRAIKAARALNLPGDVDAWRAARAEIKRDVLEKGYDPDRETFVQAYGSKMLDASVLMLPLVRFIKADDPRMTSTIRAVERELTSPQGFVYRYVDMDDGVGGGEGTFNICTFWLADNLIALGETDRARRLFERLLSHSNDLGLFSEETDPETGMMLGNFPQAFSHMSVINTAVQLEKAARRLAAL